MKKVVMTCFIVLTMLSLVLASGCSKDYRVTLEQFMATQKAEQAAATQPASPQLAISKAVNLAVGTYKIGPSDVLDITMRVKGDGETVNPLRVRVDRKGRVNLPLVGKVKLSNLEIEDAEDAIQKAYVPDFYKEDIVHIDVVSTKTTKVMVAGAVNVPGLVQLRSTQRNILYAIVRAGGVSPVGLGLVTLRRIKNPSATVTLDLTNPQDMQKALTLPPLDNGDIVMVHAAKPNTIFVGGLVNAPRTQTYPQGTNVTVMQALAASGGLRTDITPTEATLIRRLPTGKDAHVKLDLKAIKTGRAPDIQLAAGDILWVPHTAQTRVQDFINHNFFFRVGVAATYELDGTEDYLHHDVGYGGNQTLQDTFDPFGSLLRSRAIRNLAIP